MNARVPSGWPKGAVLLPILVILSGPAFGQEAATLSFAENHAGTYPRALLGDDTIKADLRALPPGIVIHRAVLRPGRVESEAFSHRQMPVTITVAGQDRPLPLLPPRFSAFEVTEELRAALRSGATSISFTVVSFPGYQPVTNRLDITCSTRARRSRA